MDAWRPIEEYDAMKKKPAKAAFLFRAHIPARVGGMKLDAMVRAERTAGSRECVGWVELPEIPAEYL